VNAYPECVATVKTAAAKIVGPARAGLPMKTMGAEDFSYFLEARPGAFFFVGAALPGEKRPHHKSVFDFDESAMLIGASVFVQIIRDLLL
jgi:amidohydrolase